MGTHKLQRLALDRASAEAKAFGCRVEKGEVDGNNHLRFWVVHEGTGRRAMHSIGGSPKNDAAMIKGVGNAARRKARDLAGLGADVSGFARLAHA